MKPTGPVPPDFAPGRLSLTPWPFAADCVGVHCEGRRLEGGFDDEEEMRAALRRAPWQTLAFELVPGEERAAGGA